MERAFPPSFFIDRFSVLFPFQGSETASFQGNPAFLTSVVQKKRNLSSLVTVLPSF